MDGNEGSPTLKIGGFSRSKSGATLMPHPPSHLGVAWSLLCYIRMLSP